ncbi:MAG: class I SAM-dependent methyltransferase [Planctomycetota bacterium]|nr:class I SAM-dependent methyltransferase [Planctomycetota bacterium]
MENAAQLENWNGPGALEWVRFQKQIDRAVEQFHGFGLESMAAKSGERIIDIGCGSGRATLDLAEAVGSQGQVLGLDFSEPLLALARERCAHLDCVSFQHGDAGQARPESGFDALFSRFGVMFFKRPAASFANLRKTLRPGGRLTFICWQGKAQNAWIHEPMDRLIPFLPEAPEPLEPNAPGAFGLADPDFTRSQLIEAGFQDIEIESKHGSMVFSTDGVSSAVEFNMRLSPAMGLAQGLPPETLLAIRKSFAQLFERYSQGPVVALPASAWLITARNHG